MTFFAHDGHVIKYTRKPYDSAAVDAALDAGERIGGAFGALVASQRLISALIRTWDWGHAGVQTVIEPEWSMDGRLAAAFAGVLLGEAIRELADSEVPA